MVSFLLLEVLYAQRELATTLSCGFVSYILRVRSNQTLSSSKGIWLMGIRLFHASLPD